MSFHPLAFINDIIEGNTGQGTLLFLWLMVLLLVVSTHHLPPPSAGAVALAVEEDRGGYHSPLQLELPFDASLEPHELEPCPVRRHHGARWSRTPEGRITHVRSWSDLH